MKDWMRNLLSIRQKRRAPSAKGAPKIGGVIMLDGITMQITEPVPRELWEWMVLSGWRNVPVANDRRATTQLAPEALAQLIRAPAAERNGVHAALLVTAQKAQKQGR